MFLLRALFLTQIFALSVVSALRNITLDDTNSQIVYKGTWQPSSTHLSSLDYGGSHTTSVVQGSNATLTFTGVAVYFLSPLWPYKVNTVITLDSGKPILLDLTDHSLPDRGTGPETKQSQAIWGVTGLNNTQHTIVASMDAAGPYVVVDAFIYTVVDVTDTTALPLTASTVGSNSPSGSIAVLGSSSTSSVSSSSKTSTSTMRSSSSSSSAASVSRSIAPPTASASQSSDSSGSNSSKHTLAIAVGVIVGVLVLLIAAILFALCCRGRDKRKSVFGAGRNSQSHLGSQARYSEDPGPAPMVPPRPSFLYGPDHEYYTERMPMPMPEHVHNIPPPPMTGDRGTPVLYPPNQLTPISEASTIAASQRRSHPVSTGHPRSSIAFSYATDRSSSNRPDHHQSADLGFAAPSESSFGQERRSMGSDGHLEPGAAGTRAGGLRPGSHPSFSSASDTEFGRRSQVGSPRKSDVRFSEK